MIFSKITRLAVPAVALTASFTAKAFSQTATPAIVANNRTVTPVSVGQPAGDIKFPIILNSSIKSGSLSSFKGKFVILDFWSTGCGSCILEMPHMLELQKKFGDKFQVLIVTPDSLDDVKAFYDRRPELKLPTVIGDTEVFSPLTDRFGIPTLSTYVWIDGQGIVRGITGSEQITEENVQAILDGKDVKLSLKSALGVRKELDYDKPFMIGDNTGGITDLKYHSVLTGYLPGQNGSTQFGSGIYKDRKIAFFNHPLQTLLTTAASHVYGKSNEPFSDNRVKLEMDDTVGFNDYRLSENMYSYELIVPPSQSGRLYNIMLSDLENTLGLTVTLERRTTKVYTLVKVGNGPKPSAGDKQPLSKTPAIYIPNKSAAFFVEVLNHGGSHLPVLDETGLTYNFDVTLPLQTKGLEQSHQVLRPQGLDLQEAEREIDILVIRKKM